MDSRLKAILKNLPAKKPRSRLEPYRELIREMRRRSRSYREIIQVLHKQCGVKVSVSTLHDFVRLRSRSKPIPSAHSGAKQITNQSKTSVGHSKNIGLTISTLRGRKEYEDHAKTNKALQETRIKAPTKRTLFHYDPNEPLRLTDKR